MSRSLLVTRRTMLKTGLAGAPALILGFYLPRNLFSASPTKSPTAKTSAVFSPNAWLRIDSRGGITLLVEPAEIGQGVRTSMPMLLAEELDADWTKIKIQQAPTKPDIYKHLGTGGSSSVRENYLPLRQAGAAARALLITAAAQTWKVEPSACHTADGAVVHSASKRRLTYGTLAEAASKLPAPDPKKISLKQPKDFRFLGKPVHRLDTPSKVDGSAKFGLDVKVPGMLYAVIARCPTFGGKAVKFDDSKAKAVAGVHAVVQINPVPSPANTAGGVAVVADSTWAAIKGRKALQIDWDRGENASENTASMRKQMAELAGKSPLYVARTVGDAASAISKAPKKIEAVYELPFQPHATMEPMNCTAHVEKDRVEIWAPTQSPDWIQGVVAGLVQLNHESVMVHETLSGGGFGRRYQTDYAVEAVQVSKAVGKPVKLLWTREDDMQHDFYRPASYHRLSAGLDHQNKLVGWSHRIMSTSIRQIFAPPEALKNPATVAAQELEGAVDVPYESPNLQVEYSAVKSGVPRAWWRSVACSFNSFAVESFIDELAAEAHLDPLDFRIKLLGGDRQLPNPRDKEDILDTRRLRGVLALAAEKSGWGKSLPQHWGRGIAAQYSFGSYISHVAEVEVKPDHTVQVHRVVTAVDCGSIINPDTIKAQMESAVIFGLTAAMTGEIEVENGAIKNGNFDDFPVVRMKQAPRRHEVYIVSSTEKPGGIGEPGVPPIAPALTNAIYAATGKRLRRLIIRPEDLKQA